MTTFQVPAAALPLLVDTFEREEALFAEGLCTVSDLDRPEVTTMYRDAAVIVAQLRARGSVDLAGDRITGTRGYFRAAISEDSGSAISRAWDANSWGDLRTLAEVMIALDQAA